MKRKYKIWMAISSFVVISLLLINIKYGWNIVGYISIVVSLLALLVAILKMSNEDKPKFKFKGKLELFYINKNEYWIIKVVLEIVNNSSHNILNPELIFKTPTNSIFPTSTNENQLHSKSPQYDIIVDKSNLHIGKNKSIDNRADFELNFNEPYMKDSQKAMITIKGDNMEDYYVSLPFKTLLEYLKKASNGHALEFDTERKTWIMIERGNQAN